MNHLLIVPLALPLFAAIVLLLGRRLAPEQRRLFALVAALVQLLIAVALLLAVADGTILTYRLGGWPAPYGIVLVGDRLAAWMLLLTTVLALFSLLHAVRGEDLAGVHFHPLFQLQLFGLAGAFLTGDLFNLFVFFEVLLIASYSLMVHGGGARRVRVSLHFVVLNLCGSTLFLFAAGTLYATFGTLNLADLARALVEVAPERIALARTGALLLFGVFALKSALLPLHLWLPASYAATSPAVAALFAIMTKVGAYCLLRIATLLFGNGSGPLAGLYFDWMLPLALATLLIGAFGALAATSLRMQIGHLLVLSIGLLLTAYGLGNGAAIAAGLYYLVSTTLAAGAAFLLCDLIARERGALADRLTPGMAMPRAGLLGVLFLLTALLLGGLPPLAGFVGKFLILKAALVHPLWPWVLGLVLVSALLGILALARSGSVLFFATEGIARTSPTPAEALPAPLGLLAATLLLVIGAGPALDFTTAAAEQLLAPRGYIEAVLHGSPGSESPP